MELYAEKHDSFRNCGTFVYTCTPEEVEQEYNKRKARKEELERRGFGGYVLVRLGHMSFSERDFGKEFSGSGFMTSTDKFTYNYFIVLT